MIIFFSITIYYDIIYDDIGFQNTIPAMNERSKFHKMPIKKITNRFFLFIKPFIILVLVRLLCHKNRFFRFLENIFSQNS